MKKGLAIGVVVLLAVAGIVMFLASHPPEHSAVTKGGVEPATELAEKSPPMPAPAPSTAPVAPASPAVATTPPATTAATTPAAPAATAGMQSLDVKAAMAERALGNDNAAVTVIEYASLTCPHCAHFATTILPDVKTHLIDTGKIRLVFRDFPLDQIAMKAAKMARCAPQDKYFNLIEVLFRNQETWAHGAADPEKSMMQLGALAGMSDDVMKKCIDSKELEDEILRGVGEAQEKFTVKSTPTFVFNFGADTLEGAQPEEKFEEEYYRLTDGKK